MSWYNSVGLCPEHVLFSKVRYVRNLAKMPFCQLLETQKHEDICEKIGAVLTSNGFKSESIPHGRRNAAYALAEKQLVDREFADSTIPRYLYVNEPCSLTVALGGKDLISIQAILAGEAIGEAKNIAAGAEELLDRHFDFAFSESVGYLACEPHKCGSGIELSTALYLPSLSSDNYYAVLCHSVSRVGMTLLPMMSNAENSGDVYILSYIPPYLCDEESAVRHFNLTMKKIVEDERSRERMIFPEVSKIIIDAAHRALGILSYARLLSQGELLTLLSRIRLSHALGYGSQELEPLPDVTALNFMLAEGLDSSVISGGGRCSSLEECDELRADFARKYISLKITEKQEV